MGEQFHWFYDALLAAIVIGMVYSGVRKGFVSKVVGGIIGSMIAFAVAAGLSVPISNSLYDNYVSPGVNEKIIYAAPQMAGKGIAAANTAFETLRNADMSKATITGNSIQQLRENIKPDSTGKVTIDIPSLDLSQTGIPDGDLDFFGINSNFALVPLKLGTVEISAAEYAKYELEDIILARAISYRIADRAKPNHEKLTKILDDTIPGYSILSAGNSSDLVSGLILGILHGDADSLEETINLNLVKPVAIVPFRALVFAILFAVLGLTAHALTRTANEFTRVPLVGGTNAFLGGLLGLAQSVIAVFVVCIGVRMLIALTGDNIIFMNSMTIDDTMFFKHVYNINFLNF